jgi:mannose-6-phosphate isomerase-like protein (cupin superfamily)
MWRHSLIEEWAEAAAEVHYMRIDNAKLHYHERTDEIYYIIDG